MRILISGGVYPQQPLADNVIQVSIAKEMMKLGNVCDVAGMTYDNEAGIIMVEGVKVYKATYLTRKYNNALKLAKKEIPEGTDLKNKVLFYLRHPHSAMLLRNIRTSDMKEQHRTDYALFIADLIARNHYDALITTVFDFEKTEEILNSDQIKIPRIYYQFDPVGMSYYAGFQDSSWRKREAEAMKKADAVITTDELYAQYRAAADYAGIQNLHALHFPTFRRCSSKNSVIEFDHHFINILFTGTVDEQVRDPVPALTLLHSISEKIGNLRIYFIGRFESPGGKKYIRDNHMENVFFLDPVSSEEIDGTMPKADFLLNIGNTYGNMVPSKIFSYFSTGKPIINFQKIINDPARKYFDRYPICFSIEEFSGISCAESLKEFIIKNKGKSADRKEIERIYYDCTPAYAAEKILAIVENLLKK